MNNLMDEVIQALQASLLPDNQVLKQAKNFLYESQKKQGYSVILMEIADQQNTYKFQIRQAALIQLKNTVQMQWRHGGSITSKQKQMIKTHLIDAALRRSHQHLLLKLYKRVITLVIEYEGRQWNIVSILKEKLTTSTDFVPPLQVTLATASSYEHYFQDYEKTYYLELINQIIPILQKIIQHVKTSPVLYLVTKILWKLLHFDIKYQVKVLLTDLSSSLFRDIIAFENTNFDQMEDLQYQKPNTEQFYYWHSKKWATKAIQRYTSQHTKISTGKNRNKDKQYSENWYNKYGNDIVKCLLRRLQFRAPKKVRCFQFKALNGFVEHNPEQISAQFAQNLQHRILPDYLKVTQEDEQLANQDPIQFILREDESLVSWVNVKGAAKNLWVQLSTVGQQQQTAKSPFKPGTYFYKNMHFIREMIISKDLVLKQMGMYLLMKVRRSVVSDHEIKKSIWELLQQFIIPEISNECNLVRGRAIEVFKSFATDKIPKDVLKISTQAILNSLLNDNSKMVKLKAAMTFHEVALDERVRTQVKDKIGDILNAYVILLQQFNCEAVVESLDKIIQQFADSIGVFAEDLVLCIMTVFQRLFEKETRISNKLSSTEKLQDLKRFDTDMASMGCLKALTTLFMSPLKKQTLKNLEPKMLTLCYYTLETYGTDYLTDIYSILTNYLYRRQQIYPQLWFFFLIGIYNIIGLPIDAQADVGKIVDQLPNLNSRQHHILKIIGNGQDHSESFENFELIMPALRNFIRFGPNIIINGVDPFGRGYWSLIYTLINKMFSMVPKKGQKQHDDDLHSFNDINIPCCIALAISFVQNAPQIPNTILYEIWAMTKHVYQNFDSVFVKQLNSQLMAVLIWSGKQRTVQLIYDNYIGKNPAIKVVIDQLTKYQKQYDEEQKVQRIILGLTEFISAPNHTSEEIIPIIDLCFQFLIGLLKKNTFSRLTPIDGQLPSEKEGSTQQNINLSSFDKQKITNEDFEVLSVKLQEKLSLLMSEDPHKIMGSLEDDADHLDDDDADSDEILKEFMDLNDSFGDFEWEEGYGDTYTSVIEQIDQIKHFRETMSKIQRERVQYFNHLISLIPHYQKVDANFLQAVQSYNLDD